jgi:cytochrome c oxidase assembly factor CtaG
LRLFEQSQLLATARTDRHAAGQITVTYHTNWWGNQSKQLRQTKHCFMLSRELLQISHRLQQLSAMTVDYAWNLDPGLLVALIGLLGLYVHRWQTVRRQVGTRGASIWRLAAFTAGVVLLFIALISPVDQLGEQLLTAHMVQHILLIDLAPIMLILGLTKVLLRPITRKLVQLEKLAGPLAHPLFAILLYIGSMWFWHIPFAYQLALEHVGWHAIEHVELSLAGALFWWHLFGPIATRQRLQGMATILYVGVSRVLVGALGIVITFSPQLLYDYYANRARLWGLTALSDQRVAGAMMELEQMALFIAIVFAVLGRLIDESERRQQRWEQAAAKRRLAVSSPDSESVIDPKKSTPPSSQAAS